jgi:hypothetical protein
VHFADTLSQVTSIHGVQGVQTLKRELPRGMGEGRSVLAAALLAAISLGGLTPDLIQRAREAARRGELDIEDLESHLSDGVLAPTSRTQRAQFVRAMYDVFRSTLTDPSAKGQEKEMAGTV